MEGTFEALIGGKAVCYHCWAKLISCNGNTKWKIKYWPAKSVFKKITFRYNVFLLLYISGNGTKDSSKAHLSNVAKKPEETVLAVWTRNTVVTPVLFHDKCLCFCLRGKLTIVYRTNSLTSQNVLRYLKLTNYVHSFALTCVRMRAVLVGECYAWHIHS